MTEEEWLACADPTPMLKFLRGKASDRKLRLCAVAYCRSIWSSFPSVRLQRAVETSEQYADGLSDRTSMLAAGKNAADAIRDASSRRSQMEWSKIVNPYNAARNCAYASAWIAASCVTNCYYVPDNPTIPLPKLLMAQLLREIIPYPASHPFLHPNWLTPTVTNLAGAAYEAHSLPSGKLDTARLSILADALEDSGCDNQEILGHLRTPGVHFRGCHVLDLLLAKE